MLGGVLYEFLGYNSVFIFIIILSIAAFIHRLVISDDYQIQVKRNWVMEQEEQYDRYDSFAGLLSKPNVQIGLTLTLFNASIVSGLEPVLPLYLNDEFHLNPSHIGLMFIVMSVPNILFSSYFGSLADKHGSLKVMICGMLLSSCSNVLVGVSTALWVEIVALLLLGTGNCLMFNPVASLIGSNTNSHGKVYSLFNCAWAIGMFIGPSISTFIYTSLGFRILMSMFASVVLLNGLICLTFYRSISQYS
eukprot:NODE_150_length_17275_cov_0.559618.p8 type:complete len:248 gc:universal NODE_150_length_17275_cov_0.559618:12798-12055(-)